MKSFLSTFLLLAIVHSALSQSGKFFSVNRDLSSSLINHIYQDDRGIIWIATENGLNRYDGAKFTIFQKDHRDTSSVLHNYVRVIFQDKKDRLLVGFFNGLQSYNYATESFSEIPMILENGQKFPAHVTSILQRKNGDILIGTTGHGVFKMRMENGYPKVIQWSGLIPSYLIKFLYEDAKENLWIGTQDKGLYRIDLYKETTNYFNSGEGDNISSLCEDRSGALYVGSITSGLHVLEDRNEKFRPVVTHLPALSINTLHLTNKGEILVGTEGQGMKLFNPENGEISDGDFKIDTFDFSNGKIHSALEDKSGNLWLGIYQKGVMLLPGKSNNFEYYGRKSIRNNIIGTHNVMSVHRDLNGMLWVGTDGDGIYCLTDAGKKKVHFKPTHAQNSVPATILNIYEDSDKNLWLSSYDRGLCKFDRQTGRCSYVNHLLGTASKQVLRVFNVKEDQNKTLWIATMGSGLFALDPRTLKTEHFTALTGKDYRPEADRLHSDWINTLLISRERKLFLGTVDGLGCLDLDTRQFTTIFSGHNRILPGTIVHSLYQDKQGTLWIGTSEGLMSWYSNFKDRSEKITKYTVEDGLPSNEIYSIQEDTLGYLWISTNHGISRFNRKTRAFLNYYSDDGLQGNEFSTAGFTDRTGQIIFGGLDGLTLFNPAVMNHETKKLSVNVTGFYIHNQAVKKGIKSGAYDIVDSAVMDATVFELSQKDNSFTIEFSVMEFGNPDRITYMYTLHGSNEWIELPPGKNTVTFSDLSPGDYMFSVRAKDYGTYSDAKAISIVVHPFWYFSLWAKIVYSLLMFAIVCIVVHQVRQRQATRRKIQEHVHAKQLNEAKLQFFINIAHEIRTPMTLILSPLKKLITKDKDRDRQRSYAAMHRNSDRILHLVNQLMDVQRIDRGQMALTFQQTELVDFISDLCHAFDEQTRLKEIELTYTHDMQCLYAWIDPLNFDKVILNVLANALKFTPVGGKINVTLSTGTNGEDTGRQEYFQVDISDTGSGIREGELEKVFECFYQARDSHHSFSSGAGIGLHLTRSIVELHHGRIWAENNSNGNGCRFIFRVPLGHAHLSDDEMKVPEPGQKPEHLSWTPAIPVVDTPEIKVKSKSTYRVLVVDDDQEIRQYIRTELAGDYHMATCKDGKEALSYVLQHVPDVVISDIVMPEMDGITLCQKIKQNVNINHIPVILLTAKAEEEYNLEGLGIGADAYILKPFNVEILRKTIQNVIRTREILRNKFTGSQLQKDKVQDVVLASSNEKLLTRIMDAINKNISNPELNVEMLSREVGISRVHLHRKLKELTSQSTRDLIRNIRLRQAAKLLSEKQMNITEVAFSTGFVNIGHFSNAFKDFYGVPPSQYMESHLHAAKGKKSTDGDRSK